MPCVVRFIANHAFFMETQLNRKQIEKWWKVALLVASRFQNSSQDHDLIRETNLIGDSAINLGSKLRSLETASSRNWKAALSLVISDCQKSIQQTEKLLDVVQQSLTELTKRTTIHPKDVFLDLVAINEDFDNVRYDAKTKMLSVNSKSIHLEDIRLGRFEIQLSLDSLSVESSSVYEVIEVDPNPAAPNENVTHPHVERNRLCEGDAQPAIRLALEQGRLLDFFQIVQQVLGTYNASSAYVLLSEWEGVSCKHCGYTSSPDDSRDCSNCASTICDECIEECDTCNQLYCSDCYSSCDDCCDATCNSCSETCKDCDQQFCTECITENERCKTCEEKSKEDSDAGANNTEVHADGVGQTAVPS